MYTRRKNTPISIHAIRIVLALVFILSGFLKAVDPWGSAIQIGEYLNAFNMQWLAGGKFVLSILQSAFELWLGLLLLLNKMRSFSRFFVMLFMLFFTVLTFIIALTNPVSDCGCFGEAIKLTNWETFLKNVILLPLSVLLFAHTRKEIINEQPGRKIIVFSLLLSLFPGLSALYSLPWIDFLPFKVGVNIASQMEVAPEDRGESHTTLLYRNLESGDTVEFELTDTTWYDGTKWEFVDTRTVVISEGERPAIDNFAIFDRYREVTREILDSPEYFLLVADRLEEVSERQAERFAAIIRFARSNDIPVACLTSGSSDGEAGFRQKTNSSIPCYNVDATVLKTILRAHNGLVVLERGTILAKRNLRQAPDFRNTDAGSGLEYFLTAQRIAREKTLVFIYIVLIIGLIIGRNHSCRN